MGSDILDDIITIFAGPSVDSEFVDSILNEQNAWYCFNRMGDLDKYGDKILNIIKNDLKENCTLFFENGWMDNDRFLEHLAGFIPKIKGEHYPTGADILKEIHKNLPPGNHKDMVQKAIDVRGDPEVLHTAAFIIKPSPEHKAVIDRINNIIDKYPKKGMLSGYFNFPLVMHSPGREMEGGLYYKARNPDKNITPVFSGDQDDLSLLGVVRPKYYKVRRGGGSNEMSETIVLNVHTLVTEGLANKSDSYILSVLWHEMVHVRQCFSLRSLRKDQSEKVKELDRVINSVGEVEKNPEMEVEACAEELAEFYDELTDDELKEILRYYFKFTPNAPDPFRRGSVDTITFKIQTSEARKRRFIKLLDSMPDTIKKQKDFNGLVFFQYLRSYVDDLTITPN